MEEADKKDYYETLGVSPDVSDRDLRVSFRKLAQKYHPDTGTLEAENTDIFKQITTAYQTLSNPERRNLYNKEHGYEFYEELEPQAPRPSIRDAPEWQRRCQWRGERLDTSISRKARME